MKWLFLLFVFDTSLDQLRPKLRITQAFNSEAECEELGRELAKSLNYTDKSLNSFSICIPQSEHDAKGMQSEKYD
jgi:hypothetical protein